MTTSRANASNDKALDAFMSAKFQIDGMLGRLAALSDDHFNTDPDAIHWGDVGTLNHYSSLLRQITDSTFSGGEHAKWTPPPRQAPRWRGLAA